MTQSITAGHWCASALLLLACSSGYAMDGQISPYLTGHIGGGTLDSETAEIDVEEFHIGAGVTLTRRIHLEGGYSLVDFEGVESNLLNGSVLYHHPLQTDLSLYGKVGLNYWDSSDVNETESGYTVGVGIEWGGGNVRLTAGFDYLDNLENDAVFDDITIYSVGVRYYYLGNAPRSSSGTRSGTSSMESTTACQEKHKDLFPMCNPERD